MKKCVIFWCLLLIVANLAQAQKESQRTITVVGVATTEIMADKVIWRLTVTVRDDDQDKLRIHADEILSQVKAAAGRLGIDHDDMIFGNVTITMRYREKNRRESYELSYYSLSQRITLIQEDIQKYDEYWHELTAIEGVRVDQDFITSQLEPSRRQMRIDALRAAKEKAEDFASEVEGSVGGALSISEFKPNPTQADIDRADNLLARPGRFGRPEKIEVSARVYVVFELE